MATLKEIIEDEDKLKMLAEVAFESIDKDNSGFIDRNELQGVMNGVCKELEFESVTKEDVDDVMSQIDANSDGKLKLIF